MTNEAASSHPLRRMVRGIVAVLAILAAGTVVFSAVAALGLYGIAPPAVVKGINLSLPALMLVGAVWAVLRKIPLWLTLPAGLACSAWLVYLAWDDAAPPPPTEIAPLVPENSKSYEAYRWLLKSGPGSRIADTPKPKVPSLPPKHEDWSAAIVQQRQEWENLWASDTLGREWIAAMAAHVPEGLYPQGGPDTPMLDYTRVRGAAQIHWAHAYLLQVDGRPNEAVDTLLPVLRASYHLQRGGTTMLTQAIATTLVKGSYERLALALDSGALSAATKARITTALQEAPAVRDNLGRAFLGEELFGRGAIDQVRRGQESVAHVVGAELTGPAPGFLMDRMLFNPNRTEREHAAYLREACRLAQARQTGLNDKMRAFQTRVEERYPKNPVGHLLAAMSLPAFGKVTEAFWNADDLRLALLKRLEAPAS